MDRSRDIQVSCIFPTRNRQRFAKQAVTYFQRQDYTRRELVIVDDGEQAVHGLAGGDMRIRYVRVDGRVPLGEKLNRGCAAATGDLFALWTDDTWISPDRLTQQIRRLQETGADISGAGALLHYDPMRARAWLYDPDEASWLAEPTLCLRRAVWASTPFATTDHLPSRALLQGTASRDADLDVSLIVRLLDGSPVPPHPSDYAWRPQLLEEVLAIMQEDRAFCADLRAQASRDQTPLAPLRITLAAPLLIYDGYGSMAEHLALGLTRAGADIDIRPLSIDERGLSDELLKVLHASRRRRPDPDAPLLYFCWPQPGFDRLGDADRRFIYTMWEGSRLPARWSDRINSARAAFAPTRFVANVFRQSGVRVPIEVIPQGVDPEIYPYVERPRRTGTTTLIVSTLIARKNVDVGVAAWRLAFGDDPDARLLIKSRFRYGNFSTNDPRIRYVDDNEPTRGISHWYARADVLLALGSEGFGLPLVEGMASGLPVIALDAEGQSDVCADAGEGLLLPVSPERTVPFNSDVHGPGGRRSVPSAEAVAERLRWVADHPAQARALGQAASEWAHRNRDLRAMGRQSLDAVERHLAGPTISPALRRSVTLWTPSLGSSCGIAEYTTDLAASDPRLRLTASHLPLDGVTLLHVQHESGLFDERRLTDTLTRIRRRGIPVALTDHSVTKQRRPWEGETDALVALTAKGAETLSRRHPDKRVEHIPHGCPTWFPPRKRRKGRVIGAFGFLAPYKGYLHLLDALGSLPDAELFLVSHGRNDEFEHTFEEASAGMPVCREHRYLPVDQVARLLAERCDVLVYWYDEVLHHSASGAVRVGLASGVPVLGSRTSWFDDLGDAVYQPDSLVEGIDRLLRDDTLRAYTIDAARSFCNAYSWPRVRARHETLWRELGAAPVHSSIT